MLRIISFLSVVLFSAMFTTAQPPPPAAAPKSGDDKPKAAPWASMKILPAKQSFVSLDGRFSLAFPSDIQGFAALSPKQLGTNATGMQFTWKFQEGDATLMFVDFPEMELKGTAEELSKITTNTTTALLKSFPSGKITNSKSFEFGNAPASQTNFDFGENEFGVQRLYLVKNRLYRLLSIFRNAENEKFLSKTLDTFKLISQVEVAAEMEKKVEALKPPALPQSPVVERETTDAQDDKLKGKVKKIAEDSEDLSGTWSVQGRKHSSVTFFDEKGNYLEKNLYDYRGNLDTVKMYGYIDGKRVSNNKTTSYEYNPPIMAVPSSKSEQPVRKPDLRYEYSYEHKFKDGKMVEEKWTSSSGKPWLRYVYNYSGNQIEELVYDEKDKLNQKYLVTLDNNGNEIEKISYGVLKIYPDKKYRYAYEFDEKGNWIKRITSTEKTENGVTTFKPSYITYRTITYF